MFGEGGIYSPIYLQSRLWRGTLRLASTLLGNLGYGLLWNSFSSFGHSSTSWA